jgi:hypothetical protein
MARSRLAGPSACMLGHDASALGEGQVGHTRRPAMGRS